MPPPPALLHEFGHRSSADSPALVTAIDEEAPEVGLGRDRSRLGHQDETHRLAVGIYGSCPRLDPMAVDQCLTASETGRPLLPDGGHTLDRVGTGKAQHFQRHGGVEGRAGHA